MEIRVTTGKCKGKKLKAPNIEGFRAVQDIAKQSIFSIIGEKIEEAVCLDLFAGSGNMGIEALSRGAKWCDFVDENYFSIEAINANLRSCGLEEQAEIIKKEAVKYTANTEKTYDLVFMDPFYKDTSHVFLMKTLENILNKGGIIVFFHGDNVETENLIKGTNLEVIDTRRFGKSFFDILSIK